MRKKLRLISLLLTVVMVISIVRINSVDSYAYGTITNLKVDANGIVTWDAYPGADYYVITCGYMDGDYRGGCKINLKEWLKGYDSGTYTFEISACSDTVEGGWLTDGNNPATVTYDYVSTATKLSTPTGVTWNGLKATWNKVDGASSYVLEIYEYKDGDYECIFIHDTNSSSTSRDFANDLRLEKGKKYAFTVVARNSEGDYIDSEESAKSGTVDGWYAIGSITGLSINSDGYVSWDAYSGADEYKVSFDNVTDYGTKSKGYDLRAYLISNGSESGEYVFKVKASKSVNDERGIFDADLTTEASVTYNFVKPDSGNSGSGSGKKSGGASIEAFTYSNEWVNGVWYNADGSQTYFPKGSWQYNGVGWWYEDTSGWYPYSTWQKIDGKWYYFTSSGYMDYSEYRDGCWLNADGSWDENYSNGAWYSNGNGWWYEDNGWYPVNTYLWIDGVNYWFDSEGYWR